MSVMSSLGIIEPTPARSTAPPASRSRPAGARDPRLWVGLVVVALSVLLGARLVGAADETVEVWSARGTLAAGQPLTGADLEATRVRFSDEADLERYVAVGEPLPADARLTRGVGEGELLARGALGTAGAAGVLTLPLALPPTSLPPGLAAGDRVDVWVTGETDRPGRYRADLLLEDVPVVAVPRPEQGFGAAAERRLVLGLDEPEGDREALAEVLAGLGGGTVTVVGRG
jgi:hypothetical protein